MKVILREEVSHLGKAGAVVEVKPGYARNYLIPKGFAALATSRNLKAIEHQLALIKRQIDVSVAEAEKVKATLADLSVTVSKPAGENEKLFGSVTSRDIEAALAEEGVTVDRRNILIAEPIKSLGVFTVQVKLYGGGTADLKVWVIRK